jgi:ribose transport system substrate-binding protein
MSAVRRFVWLAVAIAVIGVVVFVQLAPRDDLAGQSSGVKSRLLFIAGGSDPYWKLCVAGASAAAAECGADLRVEMPEDESSLGLSQQMEWLASLGEADLDGVALGPIDPDSQATPINIISQKIAVVTVDSDIPGSRRLCHIGSSNFEAGGFAAQLVREALPDGGEVVLLLASLSKTNAAQRKEGFESALNADQTSAEEGESDLASITLAGVYFDHGDFEICKNNVKQALVEHSGVRAIVGTFGYHAPLVLEVLEELGRTGEIVLVAFDEDERTLAGVANGTVCGTIVQDPFLFGYESIQMLNEVASGTYLSLPVAGQVNVGVHCKIIRKENLDEFRSQLRKRMESLEESPDS